MNIHAQPETLNFLADHYDRVGPPWPAFFLIPLLFWVTIVAVVIFARRRFHARSGEGTLRDVFARGEISEADYRARLKVLQETRR